MISLDWKKLQNGSDIRGVAMEGVVGEKVNLTPEVCKRIACAFGLWLSRNKNKNIKDMRISIGNDSRLSGESLRNAAIDGLTGMGAKVFSFGLASTPAMFMSTVIEGYQYDGAIMLTASHLPFNRNGLKFFTAEGGLEKQDISDILELAEADEFPVGGVKGTVQNVDFISVYAADLVEKIRKGANHPDNYNQPLKGLRIIVDAGNGAGGFFTNKVLEPLGADTRGSQLEKKYGNNYD
jgi:phosphomannomutase